MSNDNKDDNDGGCWLYHRSIEPNPICKILKRASKRELAKEKAIQNKKYIYGEEICVQFIFPHRMLCTKDDLLLSVNAFMPNRTELNWIQLKLNQTKCLDRNVRSMNAKVFEYSKNSIPIRIPDFLAVFIFDSLAKF